MILVGKRGHVGTALLDEYRRKSAAQAAGTEALASGKKVMHGPPGWPMLLSACLTEYGDGELYGTLLGMQAMGVRLAAGKLVPPDDYGRGSSGDTADDEPADVAWGRDRERFLKPYTNEIKTLFRALKGDAK